MQKINHHCPCSIFGDTHFHILYGQQITLKLNIFVPRLMESLLLNALIITPKETSAQMICQIWNTSCTIPELGRCHLHEIHLSILTHNLKSCDSICFTRLHFLTSWNYSAKLESHLFLHRNPMHGHVLLHRHLRDMVMSRWLEWLAGVEAGKKDSKNSHFSQFTRQTYFLEYLLVISTSCLPRCLKG